MEARKVELLHVICRVFLSVLTVHTHGLLVSVTSETARVFQQRSDRLVGFHLVEHRTLHLTRHVHQTIVRTYNNHVVVGETHIARELSVEDIVVDVDGCYKTVVAIYLYITERTDVVCAASHIEGVEDSSKSRECVGTRCLHLAHHVNNDSACLTYRQLYLRTAIACAKRRAKASVSLVNCKSANVYRAETFNSYLAFRRHGALLRLLRSAVDIHEDSIARTENVALRCSDVHVRLEREFLVVEDVASEHFLLQSVALCKQLLKHLRCIGHKLEHLALIVHKLLVGLVVGVLVLAVAFCLQAHARILRSFLRSLLAIVVALCQFARIAVVGTQTRLVLTRRVVRHITQSALLHLAFVLVAHAANLRDVHTTLHKLGHNLRLRLTRVVFLHDVLHHLLVGHRRLCHGSQRQEHEQKQINNVFLHCQYCFL